MTVGLRDRATADFELGHYEVPRAATHEDVAEAQGCAPRTAAEHLQKAESEAMRSLFGE